MVPAFPVFRLMIDRGAIDLHLTGGQVPLIVGHIIQRIPETELYIGVNREDLLLAAFIFQGQAVDLTGIMQGDKIQQICVEAVFGGQEACIPDAVMALIGIKLCLGRLPSGIPDKAFILI